MYTWHKATSFEANSMKLRSFLYKTFSNIQTDIFFLQRPIKENNFLIRLNNSFPQEIAYTCFPSETELQPGKRSHAINFKFWKKAKTSNFGST